jgi:hypothetical protein
MAVNGQMSHWYNKRQAIKRYRDAMVKDAHSSDLSKIVAACNDEMAECELAIDKLVREGGQTVADVFMLIDYYPNGE